MKIYLVGGAVRDKIQGKEPRDKDYVVIGGDEDSFLKRYPGAKRVGKRFPVYVYKGMEFVLSPFKTIEEDLWDRDLTINAVAMDENGKIYSLPNSLEDIKNKILRPVKKENFLKDPLRIYRVARFLAHVPDYTTHPDLIELISTIGQNLELIKKISPERIAGEVTKALEGKKPGNFLDVLCKANGLGYWFCEFEKQEKELLNHAIEVMNRACDCKDAVWMGMCHILKLEEFKNFSKRLKFSNRYKKGGMFAILWHDKGKKYPDMTAEEKIELLESLYKKHLLKEFFLFILADSYNDYYSQAQKNLEKIREVHLPEEYRGKGKLSGEILKQLKAKRLIGDKDG